MEQLLQRADRVRQEIYRILQGEYADDAKTMIALGWLDTAMEHHEAIVKLIRKKLYGSAFSLVRGIFELLFKAHWVVGCATPQEAEKIARKDNFDFPGTEAMVEAVDKAFATCSHFADIKKQGWKAMNSYTHGGLVQLTRRFSRMRVEPNYTDGEIQEVVNSTTAAILNFALLLTASPDRTNQAQEIEQLMIAFAEDKDITANNGPPPGGGARLKTWLLNTNHNSIPLLFVILGGFAAVEAFFFDQHAKTVASYESIAKATTNDKERFAAVLALPRYAVYDPWWLGIQIPHRLRLSILDRLNLPVSWLHLHRPLENDVGDLIISFFKKRYTDRVPGPTCSNLRAETDDDRMFYRELAHAASRISAEPESEAFAGKNRNLNKIDLPGLGIHKVTFRGAHLADSCMVGSGLGGADLERSYAPCIDLTDANLNPAATLDAARREKWAVVRFGPPDENNPPDEKKWSKEGQDFLRGLQQLEYPANLSTAVLERARLVRTSLWAAKLGDADLQYADLSGALLYGASLKCADLCGAEVTHANFYGADLTGARVTRGQLACAFTDSTTILPDGKPGPFVDDPKKYPSEILGEKLSKECIWPKIPCKPPGPCGKKP